MYMQYEWRKIVRWLPRVVSVFMLVFSLGFFVGGSQIGFTVLAKLMIATFLILTMVVAWQSEPIGGAIYIILGSISLIVGMGAQLPLWHFYAAIPFFFTGSVFIVDYIYQEKKDQQEDIDF